ncbi:MAG: S24 family peptidase [Pseudomonadota bacterium]
MMSRKKFTFADKILKIMGTLSQREFARRLEISPSTLWEYLQGRTPPADFIARVCEQFNINESWLLTGEGEMEKVSGPPSIAEPRAPYIPPVPGATPLRIIPVLGRVPAGFPDQIPEQEIIEYIKCPDTQFGDYALIVKGESMSPTIKDGDYILFINDGDIKNGDVIVVNDEWGDSMIKRYREKDGDILLTSDNPEYPSYKPNEQYIIIGKVVGAWRNIKV